MVGRRITAGLETNLTPLCKRRFRIFLKREYFFEINALEIREIPDVAQLTLSSAAHGVVGAEGTALVEAGAMGSGTVGVKDPSVDVEAVLVATEGGGITAGTGVVTGEGVTIAGTGMAGVGIVVPGSGGEGWPAATAVNSLSW